MYSSLNIVRVIKSRRIRWAGHVARMGEERGLCCCDMFQLMWRIAIFWDVTPYSLVGAYRHFVISYFFHCHNR